jgi:hypothetical protein
MARVTCDISETHFDKFCVLKGALAPKSNGACLEELIDRSFEVVVKDIKARGKKQNKKVG